MSDAVRLAMPADPEFLRLARVTAMGIASRLGFTFDEIEDLRIAIDELCFALIGNRGRRGTVELRYELLDGGIEVQGIGSFTDEARSPGLSELSELIIAAVTDEHEVTIGAGAAPSFRMVKRREAGARA
jgi:anti-sigma regulatory factor (Ser/Thr protein kinase)